MNFVDFLIGLTLANAIPHFVLGIWKGRILSLFGFSSRANILYSFLNFGVSIGLFLYKYGWSGLMENGIYMGGLVVIIAFYVLGHFLYTQFNKEQMKTS